jgi:integrating conjugative element protein (TIGR03761 family)
MSRKGKSAFLTSPNSPFPDGYDIEGERVVLKELIEAESPDPADPLFPRFVEYEERLAQITAAQAAEKAKQPTVAQQVAGIGTLEAGEDDSMTLHTRDAMRLFVGRPAGEGQRAIAGGRRVAASLRQLWGLSSNDNPYADWMLVQFDEAAQEMRKALTGAAERTLNKLEGMRQKGLSYSVLKSAAPVDVNLGFVSPYGFAVATAVVEFDWFSRVVKSAQRRDVLSSAEAHDLLFQLKRTCRGVFEPIVRAAGLLMREELRPLTRADFLSSDEMAMKRVAAVQGLFGMCPKDVFIGQRSPRHTRRSVRLSDAELRLLETVPFADEHAGAETSAAGLIE